MPRWNTTKIAEALRSLDCKVIVGPPGGDVDTENLQLTANGAGEDDFLDVRGFTTQLEPLSSPDDCEISMIEVSDGQDSRGGLNTADPATCVLYGKVCSSLRRLGFDVVPSLNAYF